MLPLIRSTIIIINRTKNEKINQRRRSTVTKGRMFISIILIIVQENPLQRPEMRMLRWINGHPKQYKINNCIRKKGKVAPFDEMQGYLVLTSNLV